MILAIIRAKASQCDAFVFKEFDLRQKFFGEQFP